MNATRRSTHAWLAAAVLAALSFATPAAGSFEAARTEAATLAAAAGFEGKVKRLSPESRERIKRHSWHPGCPVPLRKLRAVKVSHWNFERRVTEGKLIVHRRYAEPILRIFEQLHEKRFPIRRIEPIDAYGGDDHRSMDADNTSAFNCRFVNGTERWSRHAYGKAIDINPRENPYVTSSGFVSPPAGAPYADRNDVRKGMILERGPVVRSMRRIAGWRWGGNWSGTKDYQHFSDNGR